MTIRIHLDQHREPQFADPRRAYIPDTERTTP
ncbi:hypothetical protein SCNU_15709 [Gordonia neofelifaecis NRRL B-59395]|uniref:Uncharacterized protein n=1 Tax=Gordonia neofelifaecis NRRL B-59395 TaxID=644548 RepID=F1YMD3_9ACTN|nr:hypothetical protein SCNU_15709 [Gordonia neofelifaecis NRRL B-59395]